MTFPIKGSFRPHQKRYLSEVDGKAGHSGFLDPGAGKTLLGIAEAGELFQRGEIKGHIVLAPNGPHDQWIREQYPLWADFAWRGATNQMTPNQRKKALGSTVGRDLKVLTINFEGSITSKGRRLIDDFIEWCEGRALLDIDESQRIKNPKAQCTKVAMEYGYRLPYRRIKSGTPILKGLEDLWTQYEVVQRKMLGPFTRWTAFRNYYCQTAPIPGARSQFARQIVGYQNEQELREKAAPYTTVVPSSEFMKGEKPDFIPVYCPMSQPQAAQYRLMKEHMIAEVERGVITVQNALTQMQKLTQISSGYVISEDGSWSQIGRNKTDAMINLLQQLDEPVIVWSPFIPLKLMAQNVIREEGLGDRLYTYENLGTVEMWKENPVGILLANQSSGAGVGLNLQHAAANIYLANTFSAGARWQSLKRTDRMGQTRQVRNWDLIAPGTVDVKALAALARREDLSARTINGIREILL